MIIMLDAYNTSMAMIKERSRSSLLRVATAAAAAIARIHTHQVGAQP